jgi:hypothetical protein
MPYEQVLCFRAGAVVARLLFQCREWCERCRNARNEERKQRDTVSFEAVLLHA